MNYYITGKGGFIGQATVRHVLSEGHTIVEDLRQADIIVHLAAYGNHSFQKDVEKTIVANTLDLNSLIIAAEKVNRFTKFYNVSSSSVTLPKQTLYSVSKLMGEMIVESFKDDRIVNIRPYSVYGPGEADHRFIPTVIRHLHSGEVMNLDTQAVHDWIFIDDYVKGMFSGATHIGTGYQYTNIFVARTLEHISGKELNYVSTKMRDYDTHNWRSPSPVPARSLYEGLKQTYESFTRKDN